MSRVDRLRIVGDFASRSVLARSARGLAGALDRRGVALDLVQGLQRGERTDAAAVAAVRGLHRGLEPTVTVLVDSPLPAGPDDSRPSIQVWNPAFAWDVELVLSGLRDVDLVAAPSPMSRDILSSATFPASRVRVMPLGVDPARWDRPTPNVDLLSLPAGKRRVGEYATRLLSWMQSFDEMIDNPSGLLEAWIAATSADDDAVLMLCWERAFGLPVTREQIEALALEAARAVGKSALDAAPVGIVPGLPRDKDLPGFFASMTHFVSFDRGTAWNLGMMEAGAAGLRLIAPDHSSYRVWLTQSVATLVPSSSVTAEAVLEIGGQDLRVAGEAWAVDPVAAARAIRDAVDQRDRHLPTPRETILREFTWERSAGTLLEIADEALARREDSGKGQQKEPAAGALRSPSASLDRGERPGVTLVSLLTYLEKSTVDPAGRLALLEPLFAAGFPLVLYADRFYRARIEPGRTPPWVTVRPIELAETRAFQMVSAAGPLALPAERNHGKDTVEFLALQLAKTEVVRRAVHDGLAATPFTGFIDSGIAKLFADRNASFGRLAAANLGGLDRVLIPGCWPIRAVPFEALADRVQWTFCGSLFFLPAALAGLFDTLALETLEEFLARGRLTWEVNVWALLASRRPDLFRWFQSDHNDRMSALPAIAPEAARGFTGGDGTASGGLLG